MSQWPEASRLAAQILADLVPVADGVTGRGGAWVMERTLDHTETLVQWMGIDGSSAEANAKAAGRVAISLDVLRLAGIIDEATCGVLTDRCERIQRMLRPMRDAPETTWAMTSYGGVIDLDTNCGPGVPPDEDE